MPISNTREQRVRNAARRLGLRFPEPFYWTDDRLAKLGPSADKLYVVHPFDASRRALLAGRATEIDFIVEGDSWFNHPFLRDVLDWFNFDGYSFVGTFVPGRKLKTMVQLKRYLDPLRAFEARAFLLSGGGNDLIQWELNPAGVSSIFRDGHGSTRADDYVNTSKLSEAITQIGELLLQLVEDVRGAQPDLPIVTHFYDVIEPRPYSFPRGTWVNPQLDQLGAPRKQDLRNDIAALVINGAADRYAVICAKSGVRFVDARGIVKHGWYDEIHPQDRPFHEIAKKLASAALPRSSARLKPKPAKRLARVRRAKDSAHKRLD